MNCTAGRDDGQEEACPRPGSRASPWERLDAVQRQPRVRAGSATPDDQVGDLDEPIRLPRRGPGPRRMAAGWTPVVPADQRCDPTFHRARAVIGDVGVVDHEHVGSPPLTNRGVRTAASSHPRGTALPGALGECAEHGIDVVRGGAGRGFGRRRRGRQDEPDHLEQYPCDLDRRVDGKPLSRADVAAFPGAARATNLARLVASASSAWPMLIRSRRPWDEQVVLNVVGSWPRRRSPRSARPAGRPSRPGRAAVDEHGEADEAEHGEGPLDRLTRRSCQIGQRGEQDVDAGYDEKRPKDRVLELLAGDQEQEGVDVTGWL